MKLRLGISTCPNDTFAFYAILTQKVNLRGLDFDITFADVEQLNEGVVTETLDYSKASFHAALHVSRTYGVIRAGAAFGFRMGPVLLSAQPGSQPGRDSLVLSPGRWTTADLLFRCFYPEAVRIEHRLFSEILSALKRGEADFGILIHEGRFSYQREGLSLVADLGVSWAAISHLPVPLGGILARLDLPSDLHPTFTSVLRASIDYACTNREETFSTMQEFAQELEPSVIWAYVDLYVNHYTRDLGHLGIKALAMLEALARNQGITPSNAPPLQIIGATPDGGRDARGSD